MEGVSDSPDALVRERPLLDLRGSEGGVDSPGTFGGEGGVIGRGVLGHGGFWFGFEGGEDEVFYLCGTVKKGFQFAVHGD